MSLPGSLTSLPMPFLPPGDESYDPLVEATTGGTALGSGTAGRQVQRWTASYELGKISVSDETGFIALQLPVAGVLAVSLAFNNNMDVAIAYQKATGSYLYYYDTISASYQTFQVLGTDSCRTGVDDPRLFNNAASDVIFAYTKLGVLYYRQQRDRYLVEYTVGPAKGILKRVGPNVGYRFQFHLGDYP